MANHSRKRNNYHLFGYIGMVAGIAATEYMNTVAGNQTVDAGVFTETVFLNPTVDMSSLTHTSHNHDIGDSRVHCRFLSCPQGRHDPNESKHLEQIKIMRIDLDRWKKYHHHYQKQDT